MVHQVFHQLELNYTCIYLTLLYAPHAEQMGHLKMLFWRHAAYPTIFDTERASHKIKELTALKCNTTPVTFTWEPLNREIPQGTFEISSITAPCESSYCGSERRRMRLKLWNFSK